MKYFLFLIVFFVAFLNFSIASANPEKKKTNQNRILQGNNANKPKIGFISLHNLESNYDANMFNSAKKVCEEMNVEPLFKLNVPETKDCYKAAEDLVNEGCKGVFANSFGHEKHLIDAADKYKDVQFAHATGTKAHTEKLSNFHNAFATIFEGRYLTGIAAGMKLNEMIEKGVITKEEARVGYVGAYPKAEVVSGYTAFFFRS